jgi:hypothetical protein
MAIYSQSLNEALQQGAGNLFSAEFDDALLSQAHWKNPRWEGCKLTGKKINEYHGTDPFIDKINTSSNDYLGQYILSSSTESVWGGDITYGLNPVINRETTAIYIANTVVGGTEYPRYATIEGHSYVGINKILIVNKEDNSVKVIDRETEPYDSFHRFVTQDFPTGTKLNIKILDPSIQSDLEGNYSCRMNKGWLLSTFKYLTYNNFNPPSGTLSVPQQSHSNPLELFDQSDMGMPSGVTVGLSSAIAITSSRLSFKIGYKEDDNALNQNFINGLGRGLALNDVLANRDFSPNYNSASIVPNKFTKEYYTGSFSFPPLNTGFKGAFFSASKFIIKDTLEYLNKNFNKTELHLTINKGNIDFAPTYNDERSMSTFEVDRGYGELSIISINDQTDGATQDTALANGVYTSPYGASGDENGNFGGFVGHNTPVHHIIQLKGTPPFTPTTTSTATIANHVVLVDFNAESRAAKLSHTRNTYWNGNEGPHKKNYSGSAAFELSFLDKDHTLIVNIDKPTELFEGIGTLGVALIPEHLHETIKKNLEYYLKQAGILERSPTIQAMR